jgi:hypothetical protein
MCYEIQLLHQYQLVLLPFVEDIACIAVPDVHRVKHMPEKYAKKTNASHFIILTRCCL